MPRGNPSPKLAVTIDPEVYAGLVEAARADQLSMSAYAGALILADRDDRAFWLRHRAMLGQKVVPLVPAGVVAQVSRDPRQVRLRRLLNGCYIVPLSDDQAHAAGALLGRSGTFDVIDATVAVVASTSGAAVFTSAHTTYGTCSTPSAPGSRS